ncbi:Transient-receptor-potential calcium channel protein [Aphelenchoides besseyi]|nr:Transient-receptor-potential calcium channel protein [Aphelenchoides besseyi]
MNTRRTGSVMATMSTQSGPSPSNRRPIRPTNRPNMSRNRTLAGSTPAVNRIHDMLLLNPLERKLLEAAEHGDRPTIMSCLTQKNVPLNVNCVDSLGRTALEISVDNENFEIVELLLQQEGIRVGNAILCAIREGVYSLVEILVNHHSITTEMLGDGWSSSLDPTEVAISEYSNDISPIMLAAHLNRFEILQMLLRKGATIKPPHKHSCTCEACDQLRLDDSLHHSLKRINTYRALASASWMSLTSSDPILSAFRQSWDLQHLAIAENEFKENYIQLSDQCKQFACDLLSQCRSTEEVIAILNKSENTTDENVDVWTSKLSLSRLKLAIKYEQKMFVSHPHCQQLLTSIWLEGIPINSKRDSKLNFIIYAFLIFLWPVLSLCYILFPKSRIGRIVRSPFMKFLYYSTSFSCFLILLTLVTIEAYSLDKGEKSRASDRGAPPSTIETLLAFWILVMLALYLSTISIRVSAYYMYRNDDHRFLIRAYWSAYEPMLVAEGLFAVGNVLSFARIIYLFQISPYLGPLQISLGCMLVDVAKFFFLFILIVSSFALGLAQLYWYYGSNTISCITPDNCVTVPNVFSSIGNAYLTLLWSLFSITKVEDTEVAEQHDFTQFAGRALFMCYHMTSIIVLLNMLIAMMSHSFQTINDHADLEWKFHRTKLWMTHFDEGSSLPPPFNIIITPKAVVYFCAGIFNTIKWLGGRYHYQKNRNRATIRRPGYSRKTKELERNNTMEKEPSKKPLTYMDIIQRLVSRFIHQTKKDVKMDGISEDSLLEIKQDISSLRYELRDDRRKEVARSSSHIENVKRDIMRTVSMSTATRMFPASHRQARPRTSVAEEDSDYLDDSDQETKSQNESLFVSNFSPTVSNPFDQQTANDRPAVRQEYGRFSLTGQGVGIANTLEHTGIQSSALIKQKSSQKSVPPPLLSSNSRTSIVAIEKMRQMMNQRLDQLIAQISFSPAPNERTTISSELAKPSRSRTPESAPPCSTTSLSPTRVAFTLARTESP